MKKKPKDKLWHSPRRGLGSITLELLENLFYAMDGIAMHNINRFQAYDAIHKVHPDYSRTQTSIALENLKRRGYIKKIQDQNGNLSVEFTVKAQMKLIDKITSQLGFSENYHFVSFDIPEEFRRQRNQFRRAIKKMGFMQIQRSLWVANKEIGHLVQNIAYELRIEKYLVYIVSAKSDIDGILKKKFKN